GPEEPSNFISGSKHCNTEQLAIELGQRAARQAYDLDNKLSAKITAYLMPNTGVREVKGRAWTAEEAQMLNHFNPNELTSNSSRDEVIAMADSFATAFNYGPTVISFNSQVLAAHLGDAQGAPLPLSSKQEFLNLAPEEQLRRAKAIAALLYDIALI